MSGILGMSGWERHYEPHRRHVEKQSSMSFGDYFRLIKKIESRFEAAHLRYQRGIDSPETYNNAARRFLKLKSYLIRRADRELN